MYTPTITTVTVGATEIACMDGCTKEIIEATTSYIFVGDAVKGSTVILYDGDTNIGTTTADASGKYTLNLSKKFSISTHNLSVKLLLDGESSTASKVFVHTVIENPMPPTVVIGNLMWQDDVAAKTNKQNWSNAISYCNNLVLGGYSDWRLPTLVELKSIVDEGRHSRQPYSPSINAKIKNIPIYWDTHYWSSTRYKWISDGVWYQYFGIPSNQNDTRMHMSNRVRCVRAGQ